MLWELYCKEQAEKDVQMKKTDETIDDDDPDNKQKGISLAKVMQSLEQLKDQHPVERYETKD